ncbi:MAG: methylmalonyl-CoA carboxyltransferase [Planctomycetota bacterium]|nr:methylmalonyl-CoA carboxyltransferase [Planctomycetota bacterium]
MSFEDIMSEYDDRERKALAMGGPEKLARRRASGILNARERVDYLIDDESFLEVGLFGTSSVVPADRETTPADGKITGFAKVDGRPIAVASNDFTVKGASSSMTNMKKIGHVKRVATERGMPIVFMGESSGARMPDNMGSKGMGSLLGNDPTQYVRFRETPWVSAVLGPCYGSSAWYTCLSDFTVMRKGAVMAVASPQLASMAIGETVDPQELGGWELHAETTGLIDSFAESDEEALDLTRKFLSYMPSHNNEAPPRAPVPAGSDEASASVLDLLPESRKRVYDVRKILKAVLDQDSFFELKARFGRVAVTALARLDGRVVGVVANNPMVKAGALDAHACEKITQFLVMCDSFNIPLLMFVDTPGFIIGMEGERQRAASKIMNFMTALQMFSMPKLSVIMRKSYGQAYLNMGGGRNSDEVLTWPTAEVSFMDPAYATRVVLWGRNEEDDPEAFAKVRAEMEKDGSAWDMASSFAVQHVIRPQETRRYLTRLLEFHEDRRTGGIGHHALSNWPTGY